MNAIKKVINRPAIDRKVSDRGAVPSDAYHIRRKKHAMHQIHRAIYDMQEGKPYNF